MLVTMAMMAGGFFGKWVMVVVMTAGGFSGDG